MRERLLVARWRGVDVEADGSVNGRAFVRRWRVLAPGHLEVREHHCVALGAHRLLHLLDPRGVGALEAGSVGAQARGHPAGHGARAGQEGEEDDDDQYVDDVGGPEADPAASGAGGRAGGSGEPSPQGYVLVRVRWQVWQG